ncbi:hypothetical protein EYF80_010064 [Liparis tanakae]|uniref:Uncharacterized protein n=1 Tax=Liparis tanakae TaxID=230148 RepID=A0A4Z2INU5_9TELE|nr:hypothetical protein EYF80_010064 [Liparis tanakae]
MKCFQTHAGPRATTPTAAVNKSATHDFRSPKIETKSIFPSTEQQEQGVQDEAEHIVKMIYCMNLDRKCAPWKITLANPLQPKQTQEETDSGSMADTGQDGDLNFLGGDVKRMLLLLHVGLLLRAKALMTVY